MSLEIDRFFLSIQVASFAEWIKCTQKYAREGDETHRNVERKCGNFGLKSFPPKCHHEKLFFQERRPYILANRTYCPEPKIDDFFSDLLSSETFESTAEIDDSKLFSDLFAIETVDSASEINDSQFVSDLFASG